MKITARVTAGAHRRRLVPLAALATLLAAGMPARAADPAPLPVVTSFSILQDLVRQVGGDRVKVDTLVGPGGDTHVFQPGPSQVRQLSAARLVVTNGLGFEGWMPRLIRSSGYRGPVVEAAAGVKALTSTDDHHHHHHGEAADVQGHSDGGHDGHEHAHDHGHDHDHDHDKDHHDHGQAHAHEGKFAGHEHDHDHGKAHAHEAAGHDHDKKAHAHEGAATGHDHKHADSAHAHGSAESGHADGHRHAHHHDGKDPHAWQDVENVRRYVANIAQALCQAAPADCQGFRQRASAYDQQLQQLDREIHAAIEAVPADHRRVMVSHAAFGYYANAYQVEFMAPVGVSTEAEPSAAVVGRLIRQAREKQVRAFFFENNSDPRLLQRMASELKDITIGELYADSLSKADGPAPDYLSMMRFNTQAITGALQGKAAAASR